MKKMRLDQNRAPIYEALERFRKMRVVPFDVPGHKHGRGNPELTAFLGQQCMDVDVNSMKPLDNLCHPVSVIREAEELAADAFGAAHAFLMVGGTTSSVQSMVLTVCKRGDEIILPRNVHRSVINALVLCCPTPPAWGRAPTARPTSAASSPVRRMGWTRPTTFTTSATIRNATRLSLIHI